MMGLKTALKLFGKALPAIIANGPAIAEAVRQIKDALQKKPVPAQPVPVRCSSGWSASWSSITAS
jgi:hypothetical protein